MSDPLWMPFSRRGKPPAQAEAPYEGIPEHLATPLWRWVSHWERNPEEILLALRIPQEGATYNPWNDLGDAVNPIGNWLFLILTVRPAMRKSL